MKSNLYVPLCSNTAYIILLNEILNEQPQGTVKKTDEEGYAHIVVETDLRSKLIDRLTENNFAVFCNDPRDDKALCDRLKNDAEYAAKWADSILRGAIDFFFILDSVMTDRNNERPCMHSEDIHRICSKIVDDAVEAIETIKPNVSPKGCMADKLKEHALYKWPLSLYEFETVATALFLTEAPESLYIAFANELLPVTVSPRPVPVLSIEKLLQRLSNDEPVFSLDTRTVYSEIVNEEIETTLTEAGEKALDKLHDLIRTAFTETGLTDNENTTLRDAIDSELDNLAWGF